MSKVFTAHADGRFDLDGRRVRCALGKGGVIDAGDKREGDGCTPLGLWPIRRVLYRPDRGPRPPTRLPVAAIARNDGWCDAPRDRNYNRPVKLPYPASAEKMWRTDELYDLVLILGYNDAPVRPGRGSAIFLHCARPSFSATAGCVALARKEVLALLARAAPGDAVAVTDAVSLAMMD
jgi:L,D-peptidoglycan transpeptidase YkuD (ErfK/YbiS/YcfS/YnhG family)